MFRTIQISSHSSQIIQQLNRAEAWVSIRARNNVSPIASLAARVSKAAVMVSHIHSAVSGLGKP